MPLYEYTCKNCDAKFEKLLRSMNKRNEKIICPKCGSNKTARALSVFAVGAAQTKSSAPSMCARCGGDGPCAME